MGPLSMKCLFSTALRLSYMQALLAFKANCYGVLSSQCKNPRPRAQLELRALILRGEPPQLWLFFCLWVTSLGVWVLTMVHLCTSYLSLCGSFFLYLQKIFSASIHFVLINSCSVNSSNFGVPLGGDKFRVFLAVMATPAHFFFFNALGQPFWRPPSFIHFRIIY